MTTAFYCGIVIMERGWGPVRLTGTPPYKEDLVRDYETWLRDTEETLLEAIREAENENWHHGNLETAGAQLYIRLLTWYAEVVERREWLDNAKRL